MANKKNVYRDFTMDLGFKLRVMRDSLGLNIDEAAKKFDISSGLVKGYESGGDNPNLLYLHSIAKACGTTLDDFMMDKKEFVQKLYFG